MFEWDAPAVGTVPTAEPPETAPTDDVVTDGALDVHPGPLPGPPGPT